MGAAACGKRRGEIHKLILDALEKLHATEFQATAFNATIDATEFLRSTAGYGKR